MKRKGKARRDVRGKVYQRDKGHPRLYMIRMSKDGIDPKGRCYTEE